MIVLAIDPGPVESAWILFDGQREQGCGKHTNAWLLQALADQELAPPCPVVIEEIESFGMAVGKSVFRTVFWAGKFAAIAEDRGCVVEQMPRRTVKLHLCGQSRAKDTNIRTALIDRFGGQESAIGKKATPGPLYRVKADIWSSLAIAVTWTDQQQIARPSAAEESPRV